jgi:AcrR family transcriptional regulator
LSTASDEKPRRRLTAPQRRERIERAASEVFSERGYRAATIDEIARRSGVSAPVVYDHFTSKLDLHRRLLERHYGEMRGVWRAHLAGDEPAGERIGRAFDAWFGYVEAHPYAWRMLFRDTTGEPDIEAFHRGVAADSRDAIIHLLAREQAAVTIAGAGGAVALEMLWELVRCALQGLALWWYEHREVPREQVVQTAMNALWIGFERAGRGERWVATEAPPPADP